MNLKNGQTMENKQTAVDWLFEKITQNAEIRWRGTQYVELFQQAKAMEKEQIEEAFNNSSYFIDGKEYYDDTYGN